MVSFGVERLRWNRMEQLVKVVATLIALILFISAFCFSLVDLSWNISNDNSFIIAPICLIWTAALQSYNHCYQFGILCLEHKQRLILSNASDIWSPLISKSRRFRQQGGVWCTGN